MASKKISPNKISRYISLLLRHHPEAAGLTLDEHGWCESEGIIDAVRHKFHLPDFDMDFLERIVAEDNKGRYSFTSDHRLIRANQGHSVPVDLELKPQIPPEILYHGTAEKSLDSIRRQGLLPMGRQYVHLSWDEKTARQVGARHGKPVVLQVDCAAMQKDDIPFYLSANNVWLADRVPAKYLIFPENTKTDILNPTV